MHIGYVWKNAIKNLYRYKKLYQSFFVLYLIVIVMAATCMNVFSQMRVITDNIVREYANVLKFNTSIQNPDDTFEKRMSREDFYAYQSYDHIDEIEIYRYNFDALSVRDDAAPIQKKLTVDGNTVDWGVPGQPFMIHGYNTALSHLYNDDFVLEKGRMFENSDEAVIYKNRLDITSEINGWNALDLNDKIIIENADGIYKEFTVVGIKEQDPEDDEDTYRYILYTTLEGAEYFDGITKDTKATCLYYNNKFDLGYEAVIYIDSAENFIPLRNALNSAGIRIHSFFSDANTLLSLTNMMQTWCGVFFVISAVITIGIVIIATVILLNNRKYEIAVLRSIGMRKQQILVGYMIENVVFVLGTSLAAQLVSALITPFFTKDIFHDIQNLVSAELFSVLTSRLDALLYLRNTGVLLCGTLLLVVMSLAMTCFTIVRFRPLHIYNKQY